MTASVQSSTTVGSSAYDFNPASVQEPLKKAEEIFEIVKSIGNAGDQKQLSEQLNTAFQALRLVCLKQKDDKIPSNLEKEAARIFLISSQTLTDKRQREEMHNYSLRVESRQLASMPSIIGFSSLEEMARTLVYRDDSFKLWELCDQWEKESVIQHSPYKEPIFDKLMNIALTIITVLARRESNSSVEAREEAVASNTSVVQPLEDILDDDIYDS